MRQKLDKDIELDPCKPCKFKKDCEKCCASILIGYIESKEYTQDFLVNGVKNSSKCMGPNSYINSDYFNNFLMYKNKSHVLNDCLKNCGDKMNCKVKCLNDDSKLNLHVFPKYYPHLYLKYNDKIIALAGCLGRCKSIECKFQCILDSEALIVPKEEEYEDNKEYKHKSQPSFKGGNCTIL